MTWNPHKLMGSVLQCSTIHFKEEVSYDANNNSVYFDLLHISVLIRAFDKIEWLRPQ